MAQERSRSPAPHVGSRTGMDKTVELQISFFTSLSPRFLSVKNMPEFLRNLPSRLLWTYALVPPFRWHSISESGELIGSLLPDLFRSFSSVVSYDLRGLIFVKRSDQIASNLIRFW